MKKGLLFSLLVFPLAVLLWSQSSMGSDVDELYTVIYDNRGYMVSSDYVAIVNEFGLDCTGDVIILVKKIPKSTITPGEYSVRLSVFSKEYYRIEGTDYVMKIRFFSYSAFSQYILKATAYSLELFSDK